MSKIRAFSIYLLKEGFDATNTLRQNHALDDALTAAGLPKGASLFVLNGEPRPPWWRYYFGTNIPIVCDADTGWYHAANFWRTVHEFEAAGVSGLHIADQVFGKHTTHSAALLDKDVMCMSDVSSHFSSCQSAGEPSFCCQPRGASRVHFQSQ